MDQVDPEAAAQCEPPLRSILKHSLACDVRNEPVAPNVSDPVDISVNFCMESTLSTISEFDNVIKVLYNTKNFLVLLNCLRCNRYVLKGETIPVIYLHLDDVGNAVKKAGFVWRG